MILTEKQVVDIKEEERTFFAELDKGIDDMEAVKTMTHEEAMQKIRERVEI